MAKVSVSGSFDGLSASQMRYLEDLGNRGQVHVLLWSDALFESIEHRKPNFSQGERKKLLEAIRFTSQVSIVARQDGSDAPPFDPPTAAQAAVDESKPVIVFGHFNRLTPSDVARLEQASEFGKIIAVVSNDQTLELDKKETGLRASQQERCFVANSVRLVQEAMISGEQNELLSGSDLKRLQPHLCLIDPDTDSQIARQFCQAHGIEFRTLSPV